MTTMIREYFEAECKEDITVPGLGRCQAGLTYTLDQDQAKYFGAAFDIKGARVSKRSVVMDDEPADMKNPIPSEAAPAATTLPTPDVTIGKTWSKPELEAQDDDTLEAIVESRGIEVEARTHQRKDADGEVEEYEDEREDMIVAIIEEQQVRARAELPASTEGGKKKKQTKAEKKAAKAAAGSKKNDAKGNDQQNNG